MVHPDDVTGSKPGKPVGTIPQRSSRVGRVDKLPSQRPNAPVKISVSTKTLTYVEKVETIESGPISGEETVDAWVLENEHLAIKGVLLGGNLMGFQDKATGKEYLWLNKEGAVGYAANSDAFPLTRGLFLHGGIRMAAVTAEHGLYYDTDWDLDFEIAKSGNEASLIFSIQDTAEARGQLNDPLSHGGFSSWGPDALSNYPVTDAIFTFKVTLRAGEKFLRTECTVENTRGEPIQAEAWMPQTWPVTEESQIISHQKKRRIKAGNGAYVTDAWTLKDMVEGKYTGVLDMGLDPDRDLSQYNGSVPFTTKGKEGPKDGWIVPFPPSQMGPTKWMEENTGEQWEVDAGEKIFTAADWGKMDLNYPLQWPSGSGGIMYDYPFMNGNYHAVSFGEADGRGVAYVSAEGTENSPRFTKMWSWGNKKFFNREEALKKDPPLAAGRPATEYYEPWASAFNSAFFELHQFPPGKSSWTACFVPITGGLEPGKKQHELREVVDEAVKDAVRTL